MPVRFRSRRVTFAALALAALSVPLAAQERTPPTEVTPGFFLYQTPVGNVVVAIGTAGAFILGPLTTANTAQVRADLAQRTQVAARYVLGTTHDAATSQGDAGWTRLGAFVATHEVMQGMLRGQVGRLAGLGAEVPRVSFSEVLKFSLGGQEIHAVRQPAGTSDGDVLVHFENMGVVYLGESFAGDGYPVMDSTQGGTIDSLIATLNPWAGRGRNKFVGARGPAVTSAEVTAYRDMLVAVRDLVRLARRAGQPLAQVIASHPAATFDARYGHGRVTGDAFVREVYRTVR